MKRVIAAQNGDGQSYVAETAELSGTPTKIHLWTGAMDALTGAIADLEPDPGVPDLELGSGSVNWMLNHIPPDNDRERYGYTQRPMHRTRTIDFDYILEGELHCVLDLDRVELHPGDVIILQGVKHMWFNPTHSVSTMLNFLYMP